MGLTHKQLWESVADQLGHEILGGQLPPGARLVETEVATRFGVSRGPIRDALQELARRGLARDIPRRGTFVCSLTERDLEEVYDLRCAIEEAAVRLAIERASDADIAELLEVLGDVESAYAGTDLAVAWNGDMAFHRAYCRLSGNGRLLELFDQLASQTVLLMRTALDSRASLAWSPPASYHRKIAESIATRDVAVAAEAVRSHFQYTHDRLHHEDIGHRIVAPA